MTIYNANANIAKAHRSTMYMSLSTHIIYHAVYYSTRLICLTIWDPKIWLLIIYLTCHSWICTIFRQAQIQQSLVTSLFLMVTAIPHTLAPSGCSLATWQLWSVGRATKPTAICLLSSTNVCGSRLVKVKGVVLGLKYHISHIYIYKPIFVYVYIYI